MVKGSNSLRNKKLHSSKPYDVSNSFVKKVTSRVTNLLPQPSWLSKWFTSSDGNDCHRRDMLNSKDSSSDDDGDDDNTNNAHAPPTKRAKIPLNRPFPPNSFNVSPAISDEVSTPQPGTSRSIRNEFINDGAVAGPSGLNTRQHVSSTPNVQSPGTHLLAGAERKMNGDDRSESSESTSGCSSLVPQANRQFQTGESVMNNLSARRRSLDEKLNFTGHLQSPRSLFSDRSQSRSPRLNSSMGSRRRPSFSVSSFVSPIQAKDRLSIKNRVVNSPFYTGKTTYGGASAYRRSKDGFFVPNEAVTPKRCGVQVKPVNCASDSLSTMSTTARRILEALEQFSTPVLDAKRIPLEPSTPPLGSKRKRPCEAGLSPALRLGEAPRTPNSARQIAGLTIPTVPDLLKMRHREKLQDSMEAARLIAVSSANTVPSYQPKPNQEYKLRIEEDDGKIVRHGGKIRGKLELEDEAVEEVNLPNISLSITSLPKFDFVVPPAANSSPVTSTFKFASPITVTENTRTCLPVDNFTFSKPLSALGNKEPISHNGRKINCVDTFIPNCPTKLGELQFKSGSDSAEMGNSKSVLRKKNSENSEMCFGIKPATELKTGSVMDILGKNSNPSGKEDIISLDKFKPAPGSWECGTCMIRNKSDVNKCAACETSRVPVSQAVTNTTPNLCPDKELKKSEDTWECSSCHVHNLQSAVSCSKCSLAKSGPNSFHKKEPEHQKEKPMTSSLLGFGNKFKPATNTWECSTCLVRNSESSNQCQACETKRVVLSTKSTPVSVPSISTGNLGFGDKFKKPAGAWECPDCMIQNKSNSLKCLACERTKPGTELKAAPKSNNISQDTGGFKFGIDKAGETLKESDSSSSKLQGFKFGETKSTTTTSGFSFGIVSTATKSDTSTVVTPSVNFGNSAFSTSTSNSLMKPPIASSLAQGFSFGIPQNSKFNSPSNDKETSVEVPKKRRQSFDEPDHSKDPKISEMEGRSVIKIPGISVESHTFSNKKENAEKLETKDVTKKVSFSFGSPSIPNNFTNEKPNISTNSTECTKAPFSFGAPSTSTTSAGLSFSSLKPIVTTASFGFTTSNATSGSSFGNSAPNNTPLTATTTTITIATTTTVMVSTAAPSTTTVANVKTVPATSTVTSNLFTFGTSKSPTPFGTSSNITFGQPSASNTSTTFGTTASTNTASSIFNFQAPQDKQPFGGSTKESNANSSTRNQIPSFGSVTSSANVTALGPLATTTTTIAATRVTPSLPTFGSSTTVPSFSLGSRGTIPAFGTPNTTSANTTATVAPSFGSGSTPNFGTGFSTLNEHKPGLSTMNKPTTSIAPFTFGSGTNPSTSSLGQVTPFAFGNNQNNQVLANKNSFGFGTPTSNNTLGSSTSATPGFGFGTQVPSFSFGPCAVTTSTPVIPQPLFGSTASTAPSSASSSIFGTGAANTSLFGASNSSSGTSTTATTGTVVVATVAPTTNTAFSAPTLAFGSSNTQPPSNVFGFSCSPAPGSTNVSIPNFASSSTFNFNPVQSPVQPPVLPTFNPNVRPSFNFTRGETPSFTAPAASAPPVAAPVRRIKKAVRRTVHPRQN